MNVPAPALDDVLAEVRAASFTLDANVASASAEAPAAGVRGVFFVVEPDSAQLTELARRFDAGELRPVAGRVFDLAAGGHAFGAKQAGGVPGKAVLQVSSASGE